MALVNCPECGREISDKAKQCPHCAYPIAEIPIADRKSLSAKEDSAGETVLQTDHPAMFRNHPFWFSLSVILIAAFGLGLIILFIWWLVTQATELTVTDERTILRKGLLSKQTNEVRHEDVRNIQVSQTFIQRMLGVGRISVSSAGQDTIEISIDGVRDPQSLADLIRMRQ